MHHYLVVTRANLGPQYDLLPFPYPICASLYQLFPLSLFVFADQAISVLLDFPPNVHTKRSNKTLLTFLLATFLKFSP